MKLLVSACLLGVRCRYDGGSKPCPQAARLIKEHTLIPVCPEQLGGLPTPRPPAELQGKEVVNRKGEKVTEAYERGAEETLRLCRLFGCEAAVLKARSPSCGCGVIYDGSFSQTLTEGSGVTAQRLMDAGIRVYTEETCDTLFESEEEPPC